MARVKRGVTSHAKHKKVLKAAKGFRGRRRTPFASPSRRWRRRANMPSVTASAGSALSAHCGFNGSTRRCGRSASTTAASLTELSKAGITVDRKVLSDLAITEPAAFEMIVGQAKSALAA